MAGHGIAHIRARNCIGWQTISAGKGIASPVADVADTATDREPVDLFDGKDRPGVLGHVGQGRTDQRGVHVPAHGRIDIGVGGRRVKIVLQVQRDFCFGAPRALATDLALHERIGRVRIQNVAFFHVEQRGLPRQRAVQGRDLGAHFGRTAAFRIEGGEAVRRVEPQRFPPARVERQSVADLPRQGCTRRHALVHRVEIAIAGQAIEDGLAEAVPARAQQHREITRTDDILPVNAFAAEGLGTAEAGRRHGQGLAIDRVEQVDHQDRSGGRATGAIEAKIHEVAHPVNAQAQVMVEPQDAHRSGQLAAQREVVPREIMKTPVAPGDEAIRLEPAGAEIDHRAKAA